MFIYLVFFLFRLRVSLSFKSNYITLSLLSLLYFTSINTIHQIYSISHFFLSSYILSYLFLSSQLLFQTKHTLSELASSGLSFANSGITYWAALDLLSEWYARLANLPYFFHQINLVAFDSLNEEFDGGSKLINIVQFQTVNWSFVNFKGVIDETYNFRG